MTRKSLSSVLLAAAVATVAGCVSPLGANNGGGLISNNAGGLINNTAGGLVFEGGPGPGGRGTATGGATARAGAPMSAAMPASGAAMAPEADLASEGVVSNAGGGLVTEGAPARVAPAQQEALKAGAVDDNAKFADYLNYLKDYKGPAMRALDISERHVIEVVDADGHAVSNADVTVEVAGKRLFTGKSYANGELLFHPKAVTGAEQAESFEVKAVKGALTQSGTFGRTTEGAWQLKLTAAVPKPAAKLDVVFLIDATGSMGGEIARLQDTIKTVASRIQGLEAQPSVRYGLVAYRDQNEDYVTAAANFTANVADFKSSLDKVQAGGGGDKPEDVESGLAKGITGMSWGEDSVRLVFLVADAAPHIDYQQVTPYTTSVKTAAEKGIKLFPIGCSGLEPEGEFAFRQFAQYTMGQYLFITRGGDERTGGGGAASATVDKFQEGRLDDIVVDIVKAELDHLGK
jgi:Mg-chelatase subunit ChlD